tara:strand:+ start:947 stop:1228 length:282 start_codon:yes stop_codon:yes gene_type:complete
MRNKKAVEMHFMIMLIIAVIVFFVLAIMIPNLLRKGGEDTEGFFDFDNDGILNNLDKCACHYGEEDNGGCPSGKDGYNDAEREKCEEDMKKET